MTTIRRPRRQPAADCRGRPGPPSSKPRIRARHRRPRRIRSRPDCSRTWCKLPRRSPRPPHRRRCRWRQPVSPAGRPRRAPRCGRKERADGEQAEDDAAIVRIRDMERAGIDIVTDGEIRRESYSNRFATALEGIDANNPAIITLRSGQATPVPRVVDKIRRARPVELRDMEFLRGNTDRVAKITLPGPFTMSQQAKNEFYSDEEELARAFAEAVNAEALDLQKAGADIIQLDEPWVRNNPELAKR